MPSNSTGRWAGAVAGHAVGHPARVFRRPADLRALKRVLPLLLAMGCSKGEPARDDGPCRRDGALARVGTQAITAADARYVQAQVLLAGGAMSPSAALRDVLWQEAWRQRDVHGLDRPVRQQRMAMVRTYSFHRSRRERAPFSQSGDGEVSTSLPAEAVLTPCGLRWLADEGQASVRGERE